MRAHFRSAVLTAAVSLALATCSACSGQSHGRSAAAANTVSTVQAPVTVVPIPMQRFADGGLSFEHPRPWTEARYTRISSFTTLLTYLSNAQLHDPCTTTRSPTETTTTCGDPIKALPPGGVLATWTAVGRPMVGPAVPHPNMNVHGRSASFALARPGECARLGVDETITVDINRGVPDNYYEMVACLRDPGAAAHETLVREMVASTEIRG